MFNRYLKPIFSQCFICKLENEKFKSLVYFVHRYFYTSILEIRPCVMGECLEGTLLLVSSMHWFGNFLLSMAM